MVRLTAATKRATALVFPGQGSQRVGMGSDLLANWPRVVGDTLAEACEAMQFNLTRLLTDGDADTLTQTQYAQPAILAHSTAVLRVLQHEAQLDVALTIGRVLGHSLGEYSALVAAQALPFARAIQLVHFRGQAMQRAVPRGEGAMAALLPVRAAEAEEVCAQAAMETGGVCCVANYNSSKQVVISGSASAVDAAIALAKTEKRVRRAIRLEVSAPFHCALMQPASHELAPALALLVKENGLQTPIVPVVWNVTGAESMDVIDGHEMAQLLTEQVVAPVRWSQSVDYCRAQGTERFIELGYGGVLSGLIQQHAGAAVSTTSCGTAEQVAAFIKEQAA